MEKTAPPPIDIPKLPKKLDCRTNDDMAISQELCKQVLADMDEISTNATLSHKRYANEVSAHYALKIASLWYGNEELFGNALISQLASVRDMSVKDVKESIFSDEGGTLPFLSKVAAVLDDINQTSIMENLRRESDFNVIIVKNAPHHFFISSKKYFDTPAAVNCEDINKSIDSVTAFRKINVDYKVLDDEKEYSLLARVIAKYMYREYVHNKPLLISKDDFVKKAQSGINWAIVIGMRDMYDHISIYPAKIYSRSIVYSKADSVDIGIDENISEDSDIYYYQGAYFIDPYNGLSAKRVVVLMEDIGKLVKK